MKMPPVFVVSPPEMEKRRRAVMDELEKAKVEATVIPALYADNVKFVSQYNRPKRVYQNLTCGSVCNAVNHWCIWQHIALSELESAVIFEDDVGLPEDFLERFERVLPCLPREWDIFYLSLAYPKNVGRGKIRLERVNGNVCRYVASTTWDGGLDGQYAYMVSKRGATRMTTVSFALDEPIDRWLSFNVLPFLDVYVWYPSPIIQKSGEAWGSSCGHLTPKKLAMMAHKQKMMSEGEG